MNRAEESLASLEANLGIVETWTHESADYIHTQDYIKNRKYLRAVDALEVLVVQRLFELTKLNHSGTGISFYLHLAINDRLTTVYSLQTKNPHCEGITDTFSRNRDSTNQL